MRKTPLLNKIIITLITLELIIAPVYIGAIENSGNSVNPNNNNVDIDILIQEFLKAIANQKKNSQLNLIEGIQINYIINDPSLKVNAGNLGLPLEDWITINALDPPILSSPSDGTLTNDNTPLLTWEYVYEAFDYKVQVSRDSEFTDLVVNTYSGLDTEYTCPTLLDDKYWWRVCGVEYGGAAGPWSTVWDFTVDTTAPGAPTLVSPTSGEVTNDNTPSFSWNTVSTAVIYQIQIDDNSDFGSPVISTTTGSTTYTVSSSLPDSTYYWHVRARDLVGNWGSYSTSRSFIIDTIPPGKPTIISPADGSVYNNNEIIINWSSVSTAVEYNIQLSRDIDFTDIVYNTYLALSEITYSGLADDTYYCRVRARDLAENWGTFSDITVFGIDTIPPDPPTLNSPDDEVITNDNTPYFSWSPVATANLYHIQIDNNEDFSSPIVSYSSAGTSYTPASLADGVYYWRVRARDSAGNYGSWSEVRSIIIDTTAPIISDVIVVPDTLDDDDLITVYCNVTDLNGIAQINLHYRINEGEWNTILMTWTIDNHYEATLGIFSYGDLIEFYITADDNADIANQAIDDNDGLYYSFTIGSSDHTAPVINSISIYPTSPEDDDYVYFNCHATDANGIQSVTVYYRVNGGEWVAILMDYIAGSEYEVSHIPFGHGDFIEYYFVAVDNSPNHNIGINNNGGSYYYFTVGSSDHTPPTIENIQYDFIIIIGETVTISCEVTDSSGIQSVTLYYRVNEGDWISISMTLDSGNVYNVTIGSFENNGWIDFYIVAVDASLNHNEAIDNDEGSYYQIGILHDDFTPPTIENIQHDPEIPNDTETITISCDISDENGISDVIFSYRINGGVWIWIGMDNVGGNTYEATIGPFNFGDFIEYQIFARDGSPNLNEITDDNGGSFYSFTIVSSDITNPTIQDIEIDPINPTDNDVIKISCYVIDANGIQSVTLYYRVNGGSWVSLNMTLFESDIYEVEIGPFDYNDFIEYYIIAIDDSPNHNSATNDNSGSYYNFIVLPNDETAPIIENIQHIPTHPTDDETIVISCEVTDNNGIQSVTVYYRVNGGSWVSLTMILIEGDIYEVEIGPFDYDDFIEYYIVAIDDSPNHNEETNNNDGSYYNFIVSSSDDTAPTIENIQHIPTHPTDNETIVISCEVTDINGIQSVTVYYRVNNGPWLSLNMTLTESNIYEVELGPFNNEDIIQYYIVAVDNSPNHNSITENNDGQYYSFIVTAESLTSTSTTNLAYFIPILTLFGIALISLFRKKQ